MAPTIAAIAQDDLVLVVTSFAELAVQGENVVGHSGLLHSSRRCRLERRRGDLYSTLHVWLCSLPASKLLSKPVLDVHTTPRCKGLPWLSSHRQPSLLPRTYLTGNTLGRGHG